MTDQFSPDLADIDSAVFYSPDDNPTLNEQVRVLRAEAERQIIEGKKKLSPTRHWVVVDLENAGGGPTREHARVKIGAELFERLVVKAGYRMQACSGDPAAYYAHWTDMRKELFGHRGLRINFKKQQ